MCVIDANQNLLQLNGPNMPNWKHIVLIIIISILFGISAKTQNDMSTKYYVDEDTIVRYSSTYLAPIPDNKDFDFWLPRDKDIYSPQNQQTVYPQLSFSDILGIISAITGIVNEEQKASRPIRYRRAVAKVGDDIAKWRKWISEGKITESDFIDLKKKALEIKP